MTTSPLLLRAQYNRIALALNLASLMTRDPDQLPNPHGLDSKDHADLRARSKELTQAEELMSSECVAAEKEHAELVAAEDLAATRVEDLGRLLPATTAADQRAQRELVAATRALQNAETARVAAESRLARLRWRQAIAQRNSALARKQLANAQLADVHAIEDLSEDAVQDVVSHAEEAVRHTTSVVRASGLEAAVAEAKNVLAIGDRLLIQLRTDSSDIEERRFHEELRQLTRTALMGAVLVRDRNDTTPADVSAHLDGLVIRELNPDAVYNLICVLATFIAYGVVFDVALRRFFAADTPPDALNRLITGRLPKRAGLRERMDDDPSLDPIRELDTFKRFRDRLAAPSGARS